MNNKSFKQIQKRKYMENKVFCYFYTIFGFKTHIFLHSQNPMNKTLLTSAQRLVLTIF